MADTPGVLIAGAGPVGLTAAHELARRGVGVRIVDQAPGPAETSRALAVHARTLEVFDQMGVLPRLLPRGRRVEHFTIHMHGRVLIRFDTDYSRMPTRFPFSLMVDQVVTEEVLRESLRRLGVPVEWGVGLETFEPGPDGVAVRLRHADGTGEPVSTPWLVGADGAHSTVRKRLGLRLLGEASETWLNADVLIDADLPADSNHLLHTGSGTLLLVPFPEAGKWRVIDTEDVDGADDPETVRARLAGKISRALGRPVTLSAPSWISVFAVQQRMVESMRVGRCLVAGDAAHVHSPASGQGMNTGIQDAYNLAWKLADVVRGHAGEELLDSYGAERVPIGAKLLGSTRKATALVALRNAAAPVLLPAGLGLVRGVGPLKRKVERATIRGFCGLVLAYPDSPLSLGRAAGVGERVACSLEAERGHEGWRHLCVELADPRWTLLADPGPAGRERAAADALEHIDRHYAAAVSVRAVQDAAEAGDAAGRARPLADPDGGLRRSLGLPPGGWLLIRPDGYLAARGPLTDARALASVLAAVHLKSAPVPVPPPPAPAAPPAPRGRA